MQPSQPPVLSCASPAVLSRLSYTRRASPLRSGIAMKCDEGYVCEVCGRDVEAIVDSDLYLRYVLGEVPLERLHLQRERHVRCNPSLAQFIVDARFEPLT